ncbi:MAG TPA: tetratricopeptide repeat protein [Verrucomicrobiae bacterium]|nr:tetratricopeptide repeat protein [Verrucomicrobiae bacterium]
MNRRFILFSCLFALLVLSPFRSPAPLIYTPGEGWVYEPVGGEGKWQRARAKDQLIVAQDAFDREDYSLALRAARRTVRVWPLSDFAPQAQYLVGRSYEAKGFSERAFKEYQKLLEQYPKAINYEDVLLRQYEIANRFLAGEWFRLWGYIPFFPSMEKTADLYQKIVKNGPYSDIAPQAQMKIGEAREKQANYPEAVKAYERAADRYNDRPAIAADALFKQALAYHQQAERAEYDQNTAAQAIATFTDFMTLFPNDPRVAEAQRIIADLKTEQARGNYEIAVYYEKQRRPAAARIYYNEVVTLLLEDPNSSYAMQARERLDALNQELQSPEPQP